MRFVACIDAIIVHENNSIDNRGKTDTTSAISIDDTHGIILTVR
jgi:hypothetical protein